MPSTRAGASPARTLVEVGFFFRTGYGLGLPLPWLSKVAFPRYYWTIIVAFMNG